jgi:cell division protein FtsB
MQVNLPNSDDVLERHQFYAASHAQQGSMSDGIARVNDSVHRLHVRMDTQVERLTNIHEELGTTETRNKTIASAAIVAWIVISGAFGWMWDKSSTKIEVYLTKIEQQEKLLTELSREREAMKQELAAMAATKRLLSTLQQDLDNHVHSTKGP